uniref:(northern house mosquito) hypothetical protein n=1 Tax=Culex pipiens TaxID=7175 RepID=A0A8D8BE91_CULPI
MIFTTFSPSCCSPPPSVDRSDDDFVTVLRMIFFTILFTFTGPGGGGDVGNDGLSSQAGCDAFPFSTMITPFVVTTGDDGSGSVSVFDSKITEAVPFVIVGLGLSIGFALLIVAGSSSCCCLGSSDFTSLLFSSSGVFTFVS